MINDEQSLSSISCLSTQNLTAETNEAPTSCLSTQKLDAKENNASTSCILTKNLGAPLAATCPSTPGLSSSDFLKNIEQRPSSFGLSQINMNYLSSNEENDDPINNIKIEYEDRNECFENDLSQKNLDATQNNPSNCGLSMANFVASVNNPSTSGLSSSTFLKNMEQRPSTCGLSQINMNQLSSNEDNDDPIINIKIEYEDRNECFENDYLRNDEEDRKLKKTVRFSILINLLNTYFEIFFICVKMGPASKFYQYLEKQRQLEKYGQNAEVVKYYLLNRSFMLKFFRLLETMNMDYLY